MSQAQSPISSTTPEALRAAIAEAVQVDAQQLQSAVGSIQVATSEQLQVTDPQIKSLYDREGRTLTLLADRIPAGQEVKDFAAALIYHLGQQAAGELLGDEGIANDRKLHGNVGNNSDLSSAELKVRGAALLSSFVTTAGLEKDVLSSFDTQLHLKELGERLLSCMQNAEGYSNAKFNGLAESVARCFVLYDEKPDAYARIVRGVCSSDSEMFLDTFQGLRLLDTLQCGLADDHNYSFNAGTGTIERMSEDMAGSGLYPALLREILESSQRDLPNYTGQTNVAEKEASSKLPLALKKLVPHVLHYASMPNAHADAHRDVADARRVLADVAKDTQKVSTSIDQSSQSGEQLVLAISDATLLSEINRRGMLQPLYGAIGAMHDHLDRTGALDERLTQYLTYRLRREEAAITGLPDSAARVANWQECIDQLDGEARAVKVEDSPTPGM